MWWLLLACASKLPKVAPDVLPVLPPPRVDSYAHVVATSRDPLVAKVMQGRPWEASLSGAAAGVALQIVAGEPVGPRTVAWRTVLAGYPWPVDIADRVVAPAGEPPEALCAKARALAADQDRDVGFVRARGREGDVWVLLSAVRRGTLPEVPREVPLDTPLPELGLDARVYSPAGGAARALPTRLDVAGEWMLEIFDDAGVAARLPIHVGERADEAPPVSDRPAPVQAPVSLAEDLILGLRGRYDHGDWTDDPMLQSVARGLATRAATGPVPDLVDSVRAAGFVGLDVAAATCTAADVPTCLDQLWWSGADRTVLVGGWTHVAVAAVQGDRGVTLVVLGAG